MGEIYFTANLILTGISIVCALSYIVYLVKGKRKEVIWRAKNIICTQITVILGHTLGIAGLIRFEQVQNTSKVGQKEFLNAVLTFRLYAIADVQAWTFLDMISLIDTLLCLVLILLNLKLLKIFLDVDLTIISGEAEKIHKKVKALMVTIWSVCAVPYFFFNIAWSFAPSEFEFFSWVYEMAGVLSVLSFVTYDTVQSYYILRLLFNSTKSQGKADPSKLLKAQRAGSLILFCIAIDLLGIGIMTIVAFSSHAELQIQLTSVVFCLIGFHTIILSVVYKTMATMFRKAVSEKKEKWELSGQGMESTTKEQTTQKSPYKTTSESVPTDLPKSNIRG